MLVLVGLAAAVLLAAGFVLQQHEAAEVPDGGLRPGLLLVLVRRPLWLGGIGAMVGGQLLGAVALGLGSLVVVEPLLATNVLFALPMAAVASRRRLSAGDWVGVVLVVGGLAVFLTGIAQRSGVHRARVAAPLWLLALAAVLAVVVALLLLARRRRARTRATLLATAAGVLFGLQDLLTQRSVLRLGSGIPALLTSWPLYVLLAGAVTGLALAQRAFGLADISASLPALTLAEPVTGIALSAGVLGQQLPRQVALLAAALGGLVVMVTGVVLLTRSPLVLDPHGTHRHRRGHRHGHHRPRGAGEG